MAAPTPCFTLNSEGFQTSTVMLEDTMRYRIACAAMLAASLGAHAPGGILTAESRAEAPPTPIFDHPASADAGPCFDFGNGAEWRAIVDEGAASTLLVMLVDGRPTCCHVMAGAGAVAAEWRPEDHGPGCAASPRSTLAAPEAESVHLRNAGANTLVQLELEVAAATPAADVALIPAPASGFLAALWAVMLGRRRR